MRKFVYLLLAAIALALSCEALDSAFPGIPRGGRTSAGGGPGKRGQGGSLASEAQPPDTAVWVCGVSFPEGYDWLRDTAMGAAEARLVLYRDSSLLLSAPIGPEHRLSPFPDSHHLIGGQLYSEYISGGKTTILRNAEPLFEFDGAEYLKGLLVKDGSVFSLGSNPTLDCFTLRKDGVPLITLSGGKVPGGMVEDAPALYEEGGHIYFAFIDGKSVNLVEDGVMKTVEAPAGVLKIMDCRMIGGLPCIVYTDARDLSCYYAGKKTVVSSRLMAGDDFHATLLLGQPAVCGSLAMKLEESLLFLVEKQESFHFKGKNLYYFGLENSILALCRQPLSYQRADGSNAGDEFIPTDAEDAFVFSGACVSTASGRLTIAASSSAGRNPCLIVDSKKIREYPFNGWLCGASVELIAPSSTDGSRPEAP